MKDTGSITKDTLLYVSLSEFPGNSGTQLFNKLFSHFNIDAIYKACKVDRGHFKDALAGFRALKIAGGAISMPFKREAASLVSSLEGVAVRLGAINTIKAEAGGKLRGFNTDYFAAHKSLPEIPVKTYVLGAGGVATAVVLALKDRGFHDVTVISRKPETNLLPQEVKFGSARWESMGELGAPGLLFNCTPLGMTAENELEIPLSWWNSVKTVVDLTFRSEGTTFANKARQVGIQVVDGQRFSRWQAMEQFKIYTGLRIEESQLSGILG